MGSLSGSDRSAIGLDIGAEHVRVAQVKQTGSGFMLMNYGRADVPMGAVVDGEIFDISAVSASIREVMRHSGGHGKNVCTGVANQRVIVRLVDFPYMEHTELEGAIRFQAQDYIPMAVDESIIDFQVVGDYVTPNGEHMMEVLLVAAHRDMIGKVVSACEGAGLKLEQIDVSSFAIVRALMGVVPSVLPEEEEHATAIVYVSSDITNIAVVERGIPRFNRISSLAGSTFTQAVAASLGIGFTEAQKLKALIGLPDITSSEATAILDVDPVTVLAVQQALEREANKFIAEIRRSIDYYLAQTAHARTIERILLSGSASQLKNFPEYLSRGVQIPAQLTDPVERIQVSSAAGRAVADDRMGCAAAIGLALGRLQ